MNAPSQPHGHDADATAMASPGHPMPGLSWSQALVKRSFDVAVAATGLALFGWLILLGALASALAHGGHGFFVQRRIGRDGRPFPVVKLTTMRRASGLATTVTALDDPRITTVGRLLRRSKLDELPQLLNVLVGHMSLVGPRPDVPGFADCLQGRDRIVLSVRPGITGPATLAYRDEETLLAAQADPEHYNREVIYPDKVRINREYVEAYSFWRDLIYLWRTVVR